MDYHGAPRRAIIANGQAIWALDAATKTVFAERPATSMLPRLFGLLFGPPDAQAFELRPLSPGTDAGRPLAVIELIPRQRDPFVSSIVLTLADRCPPVRRVLVVDHSGSVTRVTLTRVRMNVGLGRGPFELRLPRGYRLVRP